MSSSLFAPAIALSDAALTIPSVGMSAVGLVYSLRSAADSAVALPGFARSMARSRVANRLVISANGAASPSLQLT